MTYYVLWLGIVIKVMELAQMEISVKNRKCIDSSHHTICVAREGAHCIVRSHFARQNGDYYVLFD